MKRPRESDIQRTILAYLRLRRIPHFRNNTGTAMLPGRGGKPMPVRFGATGWPDIIAIVSGRFVGIECKRPLGPKGGTGGSDQTPEQQTTQRDIVQAGGVYILARGLDDVTRELERIQAKGATNGQ